MAFSLVTCGGCRASQEEQKDGKRASGDERIQQICRQSKDGGFRGGRPTARSSKRTSRLCKAQRLLRAPTR